MGRGLNSNYVLGILLAALVVSGTWAAYSNLVTRGGPDCAEGEELIEGACTQTGEGGGSGGGGGEGEGGSGTHLPSEDDCTSTEVWRDEACQPMLPPANLSYGDNVFVFQLGQSSHGGISPSFTGDAPDAWSVTPALPEGMSLSSSTGELFGMPSGEMTATNYTVTASNNAGTSGVVLTISAVPPRPIINIPNPNIILTLGQLYQGDPPQEQGGGDVLTWEAHPPLPTGLSLDELGAINGLVSSGLGSTEHTIWGNNSGGTSFANITILVVAVPPMGLYYPGDPFEFKLGDDIGIIPPVISGGEATTWALEPALPEGLVFNNSNGRLSGAATELSPQSIYQVWANNSGGNHSSAILLSVTDHVVTSLNYSGNVLDIAWVVEQVNLTPTYLGGSPTGWEIEPTLPTGLALDTSDGRIHGTATELVGWTNHTVWANNSGGSGLVILEIRVTDLTPSNITWNSTQFALAANQSVQVPAWNAGPEIDTWEADPALPAGLSLTTDGGINGTPSERRTWTIYTIWANNTGGSHSTNLSIAVHDLDADWSDIVAGVGSVDYGSSWPSLILPIGEWSFPVGIDWAGRPIISAGHIGLGKIVGYGHEGMVGRTTGSEGVLSLNALRWACDGGQRVALASDFNSWEDELQAEGFIVSTSATPDDLAGKDCFVGEFWNGWSDAQDRAAEQFMLNGGGVVLGGHAWYWSYSNSDVAHNYPGNQISKVSGLFVSSSSGSVSLDFQSGPPSELHRTKAAVSAVGAHMTTGPLLGVSDGDIAADTVSRAVSNLPLDFDLFWSEVRAMSNTTGWILINGSNTYRLGDDSIDDLVLNIQEQLMMQLPADELVAHPSSSDFPGEVPPGSARVSKVVDIDGNFSGLPSQFGYAGAGAHGRMSTGLYAAPGEVVNVTLPASVVDQSVYVLVGAHSDSLWGKTDLLRHPKVVRWWNVDSQVMQVGNSFGGVIYIAIPKGGAFGDFQVSIENAVEMPHYIHGVTSISEWQNTTRNHSAPYAELQSDYFILTIPSKDIRNLDDPDYAMQFWGEALRMEHNLSGYIPWPRVERAVFDIQISAGWMHSGYPFMAHHASVDGVVNGTKMYQDGDWGMFHELGHNHQWMSSTLPGTTETTCNIYSVKLMTDLVGVDLAQGHGALNTQSRISRAEGYFNNGANISAWSVWTALETYLQIQEEFGWEPITAAYQEYYYNYTSQPSGSSNEFNQYAIQISLNTGFNLVPYLEAWGFPITQTTRDSVDHLPVWTTDPLRGWVHDYDPINRNLFDSNVTSNSADLSWEVYDNGTDVNLTICWGLLDGGTNTATWSDCLAVGNSSVGWWQQGVSGLVSGQSYFWRVMGDNVNGQTWTDAASFVTA